MDPPSSLVLYAVTPHILAQLLYSSANDKDSGAGGKLEKAVHVGPNINTICLSQDGKYLFASSRGRNNPDDYTIPGPDFGTVSLLSTKDLAVIDRVWGRNQPTGLAVSPDNNYLIFSDFLDDNLELYRIKTVSNEESPHEN